MPLTHAQLATQIQELIGSPPPVGRGVYMPEMGRWVGRATAILGQYRGTAPARVELAAGQTVAGSTRELGVLSILVELEIALAELELEWLAVPSADAAFAAGKTLDVYKRLSQTFDRAQKRFRIVDPYLDDVIVIDYLHGLRNTVDVELMTSDKDAKCFDRLKVAARRLIQQNGTSLSIRKSSELHDRVIFLDDLNECIVMGSSIKDAATRKPTYLAALDRRRLGTDNLREDRGNCRRPACLGRMNSTRPGRPMLSNGPMTPAVAAGGTPNWKIIPTEAIMSMFPMAR